MEINDPGISVDGDDDNTETSDDDDLQPICPLDSIAQSCLLDGSIQNIRLADIFDWKQVVFASAQTKSSFANLFQKRGSNKEQKAADSGDVSISHEQSPVEIGIDALECLEIESPALDNQDIEKGDLSQKTDDMPTSENTGSLNLFFILIYTHLK